MKIFIKVKPKAKEEKVEKLGENQFLVAVKEAPEKGKANQAVIKALASYFGLPQAAIRIISGFNSRQKILEIQGFEKEKS